MKYTKSKTAKVATPSNLVGSANTNLLNKVNTKPSARKSVKTVSTANPEYVAPTPTGVNTQGYAAYQKDEFTHLLTLLNTLKLDGDQYYRSETKAHQDVRNAVVACAKLDPYFTAQCIRYSRTNGEGLRSVTQLASVFLSEYLSGKDYAKYVYSKYNKGTKIGGVVFRLDDAVQIANAYFGVTKANSLPNAMRKGLAIALENADTYELSKYKSVLVDLCNLVHPNPNNSLATLEVNTNEYRKVLTSKIKATKNAVKKAEYQAKLDTLGSDTVAKVKTLDALMLGLSFVANTHETRNTQAGQIVADAKKAGKITEREAVEMVNEAITENFKELLQIGKMGVLALVRNLVRMVEKGADTTTVKLAVELLTNGEAIRKSLVHPMQLDLAYEMLKEKSGSVAREFMTALQKGFELAMPNLNLSGRTAVFVDVSGSMSAPMMKEGSRNTYKTTAVEKAFLIAAVVAKATNADVYVFDTSASETTYDATLGVFALKDHLYLKFNRGGGTSISAPFELITRLNKAYDRIVLLSDNEANSGNATYRAAQNYINKVATPMIYAVDLAGYGTTQLKGENVFELYGYGFTMFEDMAKREFNANAHLDEVKKVRFKDKNI